MTTVVGWWTTTIQMRWVGLKITRYFIHWMRIVSNHIIIVRCFSTTVFLLIFDDDVFRLINCTFEIYYFPINITTSRSGGWSRGGNQLKAIERGSVSRWRWSWHRCSRMHSTLYSCITTGWVGCGWRSKNKTDSSVVRMINGSSNISSLDTLWRGKRFVGSAIKFDWGNKRKCTKWGF